MIRWGSNRLKLVSALSALVLAVPGLAAAQSGGDGDGETEFTPVTETYGLGNSVGSTVGLRGSTNDNGWRVIRGSSCNFSDALLTEPGGLHGDNRNVQQRLFDLGVIELGVNPDGSGEVYVPTDAYADRFVDLEWILGDGSYGGHNCVQGGLGFLDDNCALVPGGTPAGMEAPARAIGGSWILTHGAFVQGVHGGAAGYSYQCVETFYEPAFTAAVLDQTHLVIPQVTLEAQIRAAVGSAIGAWYTVSDRDEGRDPFRDGFSISVATRGDPVPADVELWLEQIRWDVDGDGEWDIVEVCAPPDAVEPPDVFDCGGSVEEPVGEFVFDYRGLYAPTVELQWDGYYEAYFNGGSGGVFVVRGEFDTADLITAHTLVDFPVIEIRSSLDG